MTSDRAGFDLEAWTGLLAEPFRDRPVILAFKVLAAMTVEVDQLRRWGAKRPLLIARGTGAGPLPHPDDAETVMLDVGEVGTITEEVRTMDRLTAQLPPEVVQRVADYDPDGRAVWWLAPYAQTTELLGRPVVGGRQPAWAELEDKTRCDEIWDAAGVPRVESRIVPASYDALLAAFEAVGGPDGAVWSGDARDGINGGGDYVRWIRSDADARETAAYFAPRCDRVRVMPFLEGVPCSIHGIVVDDGVAVFRPVELATLRQPADASFVFGGMSTWWDPDDADRQAMREAARRTGAMLADRVGYRGGFNIDGVLTADGFRPTELNPRFTAAMSTLVPQLPLELVHLNAVAGRGVGIDAAGLETLVVEAADSMRIAHPLGICARQRAGVDRVEVTYVDGAFRDAPDSEAPDGLMMVRPAVTHGTFVRFVPAPGFLRPGMRIADLNAAALRFADERWGCDFGPLASAPDVRPGISP